MEKELLREYGKSGLKYYFFLGNYFDVIVE